jgi:signal transduction histidine kinase
LSDDPDGRTLLLQDTSSLHPRLRGLIADGPIASAAFRTENLSGRVYFGGLLAAPSDVSPAVEVVAREIGNSLDRLYVAERMREIALREDRMRVSRDLHDGVLQALTGIRLELQDLAQDSAVQSAAHDRLLAAERALATEQRELRRFIDGLKPEVVQPREPGGPLVATLRDLTSRLSVEWKTPITLRVGPPELSVEQPLGQPLRLMVHEAVINALKHGHPSRVAVVVEALDSGLSVTVTDDGRGFPFRGRLDHDAVMHSDAAPVTLRDRVAALNGRIAIDSGSRGARVEILLPAV